MPAFCPAFIEFSFSFSLSVRWENLLAFHVIQKGGRNCHDKWQMIALWCGLSIYKTLHGTSLTFIASKPPLPLPLSLSLFLDWLYFFLPPANTLKPSIFCFLLEGVMWLGSLLALFPLIYFQKDWELKKYYWKTSQVSLSMRSILLKLHFIKLNY